MRVTSVLVLLVVATSAMSLQKAQQPNDFKQWAIEFGQGMVDGVTKNFTNGTASQCRNEIVKVGHFVDDVKELINDFNPLAVLTFVQNVTTTFYDIAEDCAFLSLWYNIVNSGNPFVLVPRIFMILIFKIPTLLKAEWTLILGLFHLDAHEIGFALGRNISVLFDW